MPRPAKKKLNLVEAGEETRVVLSEKNAVEGPPQTLRRRPRPSGSPPLPEKQLTSPEKFISVFRKYVMLEERGVEQDSEYAARGL